MDSAAHYVDAAGEQAFIHSLFQRLDIVARNRSRATIPGCGFDYALGDCLARLAGRGQEPVEKLVVAYAIDGARVGQSSLRGTVEFDHQHEVVYRSGGWRRAPALRVSKATVMFPEIGRRTVSRYGSGEVVTVPRHTKVRSVESFITVEALAPHPSLAPLVPYLRPVAAFAFRTALRRPLRAMVRALQDRRGAGGEDQDLDTTAEFHIVAIARGGGGVGTAAVSGIHTHRLTAVILANAAERLAASTYKRAGVLSPAMAFDPAEFLDALADEGIRWNAG